MENIPEKEPTFSIEDPHGGDEIAIGPMHQQAWLETYLNPELGITEEIIKDRMTFTLTDKAATYRQGVFAEVAANPEKVLYKVVRNNDHAIIGFLHGSKNDQYNELGAIYLLNEAKGSGVGSQLMNLFLEWSDKDKPCHLEVIDYNDRALSFYQKYGFEKTDKEVKYWDQFPIVEMIRPIQNQES